MKTERLENSRMKATFHVSKEEWEAALEEAFKIENEKVTIKGFRKGKAPKSVFLRNYGRESLFNSGINVIVREKEDKELLANKDIQVLSAPELDLDVNQLDSEDGFDFTLTFDTDPQFDLAQYKNLEVKRVAVEVKDEDIENEKARLLKSELIEEEVEGPIEFGMTATFDFEGTVDGVAFDGGTAKDYTLRIGSHQFIPGFEEGMVGLKVGEEKDVKVTFPENYGEESLKGKDANFHVKINKLTKDLMPELNEELFKKLKLEFKTEEEFMADIKNKLTERKTNEAENRMNNSVMQTLLDKHDFAVPHGLVEERVDAEIKNAEAQAKQYQLPLETLLQFQGTTLEAYKESLEKMYTSQVKFEYILFKIAEVEKLQPSKEELDEFILKLAGGKEERKEEVMRNYGVNNIMANMLLTKAQQLVLDNKVIVD